ncbi:hypothetical protein EYC80_007539 [Monilinia laxa]|uniref:Uncharacterized protein n=1 Tax=Monilinia laxa TaxID=61186 RepID=A0A5N6JW91_MONLA|nr:hypothetical protein EYC80_007539 [Monilinia laxa]
MGTRLMTPEAARRVARAHPGSQAARDKEEQSQNRGSGYGTIATHADQSSAASTDSGQKQIAGEDQCSHGTPENLCAHHANSWAW